MHLQLSICITALVERPASAERWLNVATSIMTSPTQQPQQQAYHINSNTQILRHDAVVDLPLSVGSSGTGSAASVVASIGSKDASQRSGIKSAISMHGGHQGGGDVFATWTVRELLSQAVAVDKWESHVSARALYRLAFLSSTSSTSLLNAPQHSGSAVGSDGSPPSTIAIPTKGWRQRLLTTNTNGPQSQLAPLAPFLGQHLLPELLHQPSGTTMRRVPARSHPLHVKETEVVHVPIVACVGAAAVMLSSLTSSSSSAATQSEVGSAPSRATLCVEGAWAWLLLSRLLLQRARAAGDVGCLQESCWKAAPTVAFSASEAIRRGIELLELFQSDQLKGCDGVAGARGISSSLGSSDFSNAIPPAAVSMSFDSNGLTAPSAAGCSSPASSATEDEDDVLLRSAMHCREGLLCLRAYVSHLGLMDARNSSPQKEQLALEEARSAWSAVFSSNTAIRDATKEASSAAARLLATYAATTSSPLSKSNPLHVSSISQRSPPRKAAVLLLSPKSSAKGFVAGFNGSGTSSSPLSRPPPPPLLAADPTQTVAVAAGHQTPMIRRPHDLVRDFAEMGLDLHAASCGRSASAAGHQPAVPTPSHSVLFSRSPSWIRNCATSWRDHVATWFTSSSAAVSSPSPTAKLQSSGNMGQSAVPSLLELLRLYRHVGGSDTISGRIALFLAIPLLSVVDGDQGSDENNDRDRFFRLAAVSSSSPTISLSDHTAVLSIVADCFMFRADESLASGVEKGDVTDVDAQSIVSGVVSGAFPSVMRGGEVLFSSVLSPPQEACDGSTRQRVGRTTTIIVPPEAERRVNVAEAGDSPETCDAAPLPMPRCLSSLSSIRQCLWLGVSTLLYARRCESGNKTSPLHRSLGQADDTMLQKARRLLLWFVQHEPHDPRGYLALAETIPPADQTTQLPVTVATFASPQLLSRTALLLQAYDAVSRRPMPVHTALSDDMAMVAVPRIDENAGMVGTAGHVKEEDAWRRYRHRLQLSRLTPPAAPSAALEVVVQRCLEGSILLRLAEAMTPWQHCALTPHASNATVSRLQVLLSAVSQLDYVAQTWTTDATLSTSLVVILPAWNPVDLMLRTGYPLLDETLRRSQVRGQVSWTAGGTMNDDGQLLTVRTQDLAGLVQRQPLSPRR